MNINAEKNRVLTLLGELKYHPHRLRGQNYLVDLDVVDRILQVEPLCGDEVVLEIGPGAGAITGKLANAAGHLYALEIEDKFADYLADRFAFEDHVDVIHGDALKFNYDTLAEGAPFRIFANVPYNITTPLLKKLLTDGGNWTSMVLMLQKEAAERITEGKRRQNGPLTLLMEYCATSRIAFPVAPASFYPKPAVDSAIIYVERRATPPVEAPLQPLMRLIEAAFRERRKQLSNTLSAAYPQDGREFWQEILAEAGLAPTCRAEELTLADFAALYQLAEARRKQA